MSDVGARENRKSGRDGDLREAQMRADGSDPAPRRKRRESSRATEAVRKKPASKRDPAAKAKKKIRGSSGSLQISGWFRPS